MIAPILTSGALPALLGAEDLADLRSASVLSLPAVSWWSPSDVSLRLDAAPLLPNPAPRLVLSTIEDIRLWKDAT
eukprot:CAMPEP_0117666880 /NCGR_PEP_ID=MMETSP0804-20121206/10632_1 /TAXON_ID=1074897 /ORGANISM="Tetraselmis astigmatica, Strain CCMP880" /LENGTH=74 /DNA_ID=CAMNT_0005474495 /DNA_START=305 /DNA_END=530 /DNA_ORIENTATION=-